MNLVKVALAFALLGIFLPVEASEAGRPVLLSMQAALDVDPDGRVSALTYVDGGNVPDAIRQRGEQVASAWRFVPPEKAGKAVGGRTYVRMTACMVHRNGSLEVSFGYSGNGPAGILRSPRRPVSMPLPVRRLMGQGITGVRGTLVYVVSADGKAQLESATMDDPKLQAQYGHLWRRLQRSYLKALVHRPELIDGLPTATRVETVSEEMWGPGKALDAKVQALHEQSATCQALTNDGGHQIASDSPFQRAEG